MPLPPPLSPGGRPLADFGTRLLAYLIDSLLVSAVMMVIILPATFVFVFAQLPEQTFTYRPDQPPLDLGALFLPFLLFEAGVIALLLAAYYVYYVEMMRRSGQTFGKKAMKIQVVPLDPAATLTRGMAAKRYLVEFVGGVLIPLFSYLDGFWQLWDKPYQQTLHDKAAGTVVVKVFP